MTNLPIAVSSSQPPAKVACPAQKNDAMDAPPENPFGEVLARQMDEADNPSSGASSSASGTDTKTASDSAKSTDKTEQSAASATANVPGDQASILVAMLQFPQEIKAAVIKDAGGGATATTGETGLGKGKVEANSPATDAGAAQVGTRFDMTAAASGKAGKAIMASDAAMAATDKAGAAKAATSQPDASATQQAITKFDMTAAASGKTEAAIMAADAAAATARGMTGMASHNGLNPENIKPAELPAGLLNTTQSAQSAAQSIGSMAVSGIPSSILPENKTANNLQTISSPLGSNNWPDEFAQKISWMSSQRNQIAELHLNPPNLGPLDVVLKISDNQATAFFTSPHSAVRDAVENALPRLRDVLADNGIMLGNATVSDQSQHSRTEWFANQNSNSAAQRETSIDLLKAPGLSAASAQIVPVRRHNGMVDTFA